MSNTRRASEGGPFRQERYASAPEFERGLMANLVAKRCSVLVGRENRQLVWFLQLLSHQQGGIKKLVQDLRSHFPKRFGSRMEEDIFSGTELSVDARLEREITDLALDPSIQVEDGKVSSFHLLVSTLREFKAEWIAARQPQVVTTIGEAVCGALEYAAARRRLVIIDGTTRIGKSHAAKTWCNLNPGSTRYVELTASNDDITFFREIAACLGVSVNLNSKAQELRGRIEETLRGGDLMLVIDEAHYLWPQRHYHNTTPARINWIMTALVNRGVAVALVTTPQFFRSLAAIEKGTHWTSDQFKGRIGRYVKLPAVLSDNENEEMAQLEDVARAMLPGVGAASIRAAVCCAKASGKYLGALDAIADTAKYFCESGGRQKVEFKDIERAIRESVTPSDEALKTALATATEAKRRRVSKVVAAPLQGHLRRDAALFPGDGFPARDTAPAPETSIV